jgi:hypothetical protein
MFLQHETMYAEVQVPLLKGTCPFGLSLILHLKDGFFRFILATPFFMMSFGRRPRVVFEDPSRGRRYLDK